MSTFLFVIILPIVFCVMISVIRQKKKIMFVSCYPIDPVWNPPTQNFLLTQGEKKRGKYIFD